MQPLQPDQLQRHADKFLPPGPGPMVGRHILNTGCGALYADRFPQPRLVFSRSGGNLAMAGDPAVLPVSQLRELIQDGMLEATFDFEPLLREAFNRVLIWDRLIYTLEREPSIPKTSGFFLRRLSQSDTPTLEAISESIRWIWNTWKDAPTLAGSGFAWGAFQGDRLVSLACSFFVGDDFEDIGVVTEPEFRRQGLSTACTGQLCIDIQARGRCPSWTTSPTNLASQGVAEKAGFELFFKDFLFVINTDIPD